MERWPLVEVVSLYSFKTESNGIPLGILHTGIFVVHWYCFYLRVYAQLLIKILNMYVNS